MKHFWTGFEKRASMMSAPEGPKAASFTNFKPQGLSATSAVKPRLAAATPTGAASYVGKLFRGKT